MSLELEIDFLHQTLDVTRRRHISQKCGLHGVHEIVSIRKLDDVVDGIAHRPVVLDLDVLGDLDHPPLDVPRRRRLHRRQEDPVFLVSAAQRRDDAAGKRQDHDGREGELFWLG